MEGEDTTRLRGNVELEGPLDEHRPTPIEALANAKSESDATPHVQDALAYLLDAFHNDEGQVVERVLRVNVGTPNNPEIIRWVVKNIPGPKIRQIREDAEEKARRTKGSSGATAGFEGNVRVVIEGTVEPDIKKGAREIGLADPADFLERALLNKQGLIEQLAGAILTLSGYDDEDVNDELEAKASGNS